MCICKRVLTIVGGLIKLTRSRTYSRVNFIIEDFRQKGNCRITIKSYLFCRRQIWSTIQLDLWTSMLCYLYILSNNLELIRTFYANWFNPSICLLKLECTENKWTRRIQLQFILWISIITTTVIQLTKIYLAVPVTRFKYILPIA